MMAERPPAARKVDPFSSTVRNTEDGGLDELVPYTSVVMRERLRAHTMTDQFVASFTHIVGGSLRPNEGGSWARCRKASAWLRPQETKASHADLARLRSRIESEDREVRDFADLVMRLCGIWATFRSPILTEGERLAWTAAIDLAVFADIPETFEAITAAFPGAEVIQFPSPANPPADSGEGGALGGASPSTRPRLVPEHGVTFPEGYTDDVDLTGTVSDIKRRLNQHLHAHLIAEVEGKNRKGLVDWLVKSKLNGFRIPEEWREDES